MALLEISDIETMLAQQPDLVSRLGLGRVIRVSPLASGEYHQNFLVDDEFSAPPMVLRINHGSQLGLAEQLAYEAAALRMLQPTGIPPLLIHYQEATFDHPAFLLEEFIPGRPLDYGRDLEPAAQLFARLHGFRPETHGLIEAPRPFETLLADSASLLARAAAEGSLEAPVVKMLLKAHTGLATKAESLQPLVEAVGSSVVNSEVNAGNFLVDDEAATIRLVDWEKPLLSSPLVDLGHFWAPSTILWKGETMPAAAAKEAFLATYCATFPDKGAAIRELLPAAIQYSALRGISWCASVHGEYREGRKALSDPATLTKIEHYLHVEFLEEVFGE